MEDGKVGGTDVPYYVMIVERKPGLTGLLVSASKEILVRSTPITSKEMSQRVGADIAELLRPKCVQMTEPEIHQHTNIETLDKFGVAGWVILYRDVDLQSAGLL